MDAALVNHRRSKDPHPGWDPLVRTGSYLTVDDAGPHAALSSAARLVVLATAGTLVDGIQPPPAGVAAELVIVAPAGATLRREAAGADPAARIRPRDGADLVLGADGMAVLVYDPSAARWRGL